MAEKERKRQGKFQIVNLTRLPFHHFQGKDLSKFRRIPAEFRHLEEKARKRKGKETDRCFLKHSIVQAKLFQVAPPSRFSNHPVHCAVLVTGTQHKKHFELVARSQILMNFGSMSKVRVSIRRVWGGEALVYLH